MAGRAPPTNPFYRNQSSTAAPPSQAPTSPAPPSYSRPVPAPPSGPVSYGSLSDLTKGKSGASAGRPGAAGAGGGGFDYTPDPSRQGYRSDYTTGNASQQSGFGGGGGSDGGRRMPPPPGNYGVGVPNEPPRRNVATTDPRASAATATSPAGAPTFQSRLATAQTTAAGYIPNSVSATATSLGDRARGTYDSLTTQQRREQVAAGAGKVAAGAAKLAGKAAWQLGKFASGSK